MVAGREIDRLLLGRVRRIRVADSRPGRHRRAEEDRARTVVLLHAGMVPRLLEDRVQRQAPESLVRGRGQGHAGQGGHRLLRRRVVRRGLVARRQVAHLYPAAAQSPARGAALLARPEEVVPGHRRHERRAVSALRSQREVPVLHREHRHGPGRGRLRHVERRAPRDAQRLHRRARQGTAVAAGARERRGKGKETKDAKDTKEEGRRRRRIRRSRRLSP